MYSSTLMSVGQPEEYRSVRKYGVPSRYSGMEVALGLKPSILPQSEENSDRVMSDVQHLADAEVPLE